MSTIALFPILKYWRLPSPTQRLVAIYCGDQANDDGECFFSIARAMEWTSLSERAVRAALAALEAQGKIRRLMRPGRTTAILLNLPETPAPRAGVGAAPRAGGGAPRAGGGAPGAALYKEPLTLPPTIPKERDKNRGGARREESAWQAIGKLNDAMLMQMCKAQNIATRGRSRDELVTMLRRNLS